MSRQTEQDLRQELAIALATLGQIHRIADQIIGDGRCTERPGCLLAKGVSVRGIMVLASQALAANGIPVEDYYATLADHVKERAER